jgi:hypothetical protein
MPKFVGRVSRSDVEGGHWVLITDQGVCYQLDGGGPDLLRDGAHAEVEGRIASGKMGIAMVGDILEVRHYRLLG